MYDIHMIRQQVYFRNIAAFNYQSIILCLMTNCQFMNCWVLGDHISFGHNLTVILFYIMCTDELFDWNFCIHNINLLMKIWVFFLKNQFCYFFVFENSSSLIRLWITNTESTKDMKFATPIIDFSSISYTTERNVASMCLFSLCKKRKWKERHCCKLYVKFHNQNLEMIQNMLIKDDFN